MRLVDIEINDNPVEVWVEVDSHFQYNSSAGFYCKFVLKYDKNVTYKTATYLTSEKAIHEAKAMLDLFATKSPGSSHNKWVEFIYAYGIKDKERLSAMMDAYYKRRKEAVTQNYKEWR